MTKIDIYETEADFIVFRFQDEDAATAAEKHFPVDFVRSGEGMVEYRADPSAIEGIRANLESAGVEWTETESGLTEDEMWPEWPEDAETSDPAP